MMRSDCVQVSAAIQRSSRSRCSLCTTWRAKVPDCGYAYELGNVAHTALVHVCVCVPCARACMCAYVGLWMRMPDEEVNGADTFGQLWAQYSFKMLNGTTPDFTER